MSVISNLEDQLKYAGVEESGPQDKDGYTRYSVICEERLRGKVQRRLFRLEKNSLIVNGTTRDVDILVSGVDGQPISELGATFVVYVED